MKHLGIKGPHFLVIHATFSEVQVSLDDESPPPSDEIEDYSKDIDWDWAGSPTWTKSALSLT